MPGKFTDEQRKEAQEKLAAMRAAGWKPGMGGLKKKEQEEQEGQEGKPSRKGKVKYFKLKTKIMIREEYPHEVLIGLMFLRGWSPNDLAHRLGCSSGTVRKFLYEDDLPPADYQDLIRMIFGYPIEVLFAKKPENISNRIIKAILELPFEGRLAKATDRYYVEATNLTREDVIRGLQLLEHDKIIKWVGDADGMIYVIAQSAFDSILANKNK